MTPHEAQVHAPASGAVPARTAGTVSTGTAQAGTVSTGTAQAGTVRAGAAHVGDDHASTAAAVRNTRQRTAVGCLLNEVEGFHSAQELHAMLRARGERVGLTTVYRTLQALADLGEIDVMRPPGGEHLYRRCSEGHHHHLVCRSCGRTVEVAGPAVETWADTVAGRHGFVDVSHTIEIFGTCPRCAAP